MSEEERKIKDVENRECGCVVTHYEETTTFHEPAIRFQNSVALKMLSAYSEMSYQASSGSEAVMIVIMVMPPPRFLLGPFSVQGSFIP